MNKLKSINWKEILNKGRDFVSISIGRLSMLKIGFNPSKKKVINLIPKKQNKNWKKVLLIGGIITVGSLLLAYIGIALFFINHFYWGTVINEIEVGGYTPEEVDSLLKGESKNYILTLEERLIGEEVLYGSDVGLVYDYGNHVEAIKKEQAPFAWPMEVFKEHQYDIDREITYDKGMLEEKMDTLACFNEDKISMPQDAKVIYKNGRYEIEAGDIGNNVNRAKLYQEIAGALLDEATSLNLEEKVCYQKAFYTTDSPELKALQEELNHYVSAEITYDFGDRVEVIDSRLIHNWLSFDETFEVTLDENAVADYIIELGKSYDTLGITRDFVTSEGNKVKVNGGDYGWSMNEEDEIGKVLEEIREGVVVTREPLYNQKAWNRNTNDIGDTYVEVNLTKQYLWFYKEGKLIVESDVVTGTLNGSYDTPEGTYRLKYKQPNAILRGPGYASPVSYWMPFNGDIGMHDATWRSRFGGTINTYGGSHGCVNLPLNVAKAIYENIEPNMPVVCYFEK